MEVTAALIQSAYEKFIEAEERRSSSGQRSSVYASSWSACTRAMALDMLVPDAKPQFAADTLANFRRGNDRARDIKADMSRVGRFADPPFDVVGAEERFELRDTKGRVVIVGRVDFRLKFAGVHGSKPVETKSWHPLLVQGVKRFDDLFTNRWTRKGAHQLLAYMLATNEQTGFMLLDRPGIPRPLEVNLFEHLDKIEDFLKRAEIAMDAREQIYKETIDGLTLLPSNLSTFEPLLPPFIDDPSECRSCSFFGGACNPPLTHQGAAIITDDEVLAKIEQHDTLDEPRQQYKDIHDELADYLRARTPTTHRTKSKRQMIAGKYLIESWYSKNTTLEMPEAEKLKYQKTVEDGKFQFNITKVVE